MRIQIKGSPITPDAIKEALDDILKKLGFSEDKHTLKGVNLYFNVHDRDAGENIAFLNADGEEIEGYIWMTPCEREKHRARVEKKSTAFIPIYFVEKERARVERISPEKLGEALEKHRARFEKKQAAEELSRERERVRLATQARIQAAREKDRAKREAKKVAAKAAKEGAS